MADAIVTRGLRKRFSSRSRMFGPRTTTVAVDGLDLEIPRGRVTGLLGLNGAGKTTTIKVIATLLRPDRGKVTVDGLDSVRDARAIRSRINLIAGGERMVYARMTGRENLFYFGQLYNVPNRVLRPRIDALLERVGLTSAADMVVERYSRGMSQRLTIARGLINEPDYLLLDEPTLGLDAPIARELRRVVAGLAADGTGVLLTSHYLVEVEELCGYVYVIAGGRHLRAGSPKELISATNCHHTVEVSVAAPLPRTLQAVDALAARLGTVATRTAGDDGAVTVGLSHPDDIAGALVTEIVSTGGRVLGLRVVDPSLEDAILALSGGADRTAGSR